MTAAEFGKRFGLIGAAGYIAPRHMKAIKETGCVLTAATDPNDSVGILDSHFPECRFFTDFERYDQFVDQERARGRPLDYVTVCSPNHLHSAHVRSALRAGADAICEKPLVLDPSEIDALEKLEAETGRKINTILQLRVHPAILKLRDEVIAAGNTNHDVELTYLTSRGNWYHESWKGDPAKSGGVATNIGVHFYDMLSFVFGDLKRNVVHHRSDDAAAGYLEYDKARVKWFLSINRDYLPDGLPDGQTTYRSITVDGNEIEFSGGFTDLHTRSYEEILAGNGFPLSEVRPSIETVAQIRTAELQPGEGQRHPLLEKAAQHIQAAAG